jgi:hypothetical protein
MDDLQDLHDRQPLPRLLLAKHDLQNILRPDGRGERDCPDGGMVDTQDLKSCDHSGCAGSSPAPGTENRARVRVRARAFVNTLISFSSRLTLTLTLSDRWLQLYNSENGIFWKSCNQGSYYF